MLAVLTLTAGMVMTAPAVGQTAEELRRDGEACEQIDGYMRALNPGAEDAVDRINAQRLSFYEMRAAEEGVEAAVVAAVFAMELQSQPNYRPC